MSGMDRNAYLERIGFDGPAAATAETLARLQEAHCRAVPYENFDILDGRPISLELPDLYRKVVAERRGGYCFELNGLFAWLLRELGFDVVEHFARYLRDEPPLPMPRHRVLTVRTEGRSFFVDVGVGGVLPRRPLEMAPGLVQEQGDERYRLVRDGVLGNVVQEYRRGAWSNYVSFPDEPAYPVDFIATNHWCQHAPESIFRQGPMASLLTRDGRVTLSGPELRIFSPAGVETIPLASEAEVREAARRWFGVARPETRRDGS